MSPGAQPRTPVRTAHAPTPQGAPVAYDRPGRANPVAAAPPASLGRRASAFLVDLLVAAVLGGWALVLGALRLRTDDGAAEPDTLAILGGGYVLLGAWCIVQWVLHGTRGWTVGRRLLGIRTLDQSSRTPIGMIRILVRTLVVASGALVLGVGQLVVLASPAFDRSGRNRGWHDRAAGDDVLDVRGLPGAVSSHANRPPAHAAAPHAAQAGHAARGARPSWPALAADQGHGHDRVSVLPAAQAAAHAPVPAPTPPPAPVPAPATPLAEVATTGERSYADAHPVPAPPGPSAHAHATPGATAHPTPGAPVRPVPTTTAPAGLVVPAWALAQGPDEGSAPIPAEPAAMTDTLVLAPLAPQRSGPDLDTRAIAVVRPLPAAAPGVHAVGAPAASRPVPPPPASATAAGPALPAVGPALPAAGPALPAAGPALPAAHAAQPALPPVPAPPDALPAASRAVPAAAPPVPTVPAPAASPLAAPATHSPSPAPAPTPSPSQAPAPSSLSRSRAHPVAPPGDVPPPPPPARTVAHDERLDPALEQTHQATAREIVGVVPPALRPAAMHAEIELSDGRRVVVERTALVGRNPAAATPVQLIRVIDPGRSVSKTHLQIAVERSGVWVADRGSTNGTVVTLPDGAQVICPVDQPVRLRVGAVVAFGDCALRVVSAPGVRSV